MDVTDIAAWNRFILNYLRENATNPDMFKNMKEEEFTMFVKYQSSPMTWNFRDRPAPPNPVAKYHHSKDETIGGLVQELSRKEKVIDVVKEELKQEKDKSAKILMKNQEIEKKMNELELEVNHLRPIARNSQKAMEDYQLKQLRFDALKVELDTTREELIKWEKEFEKQTKLLRTKEEENEKLRQKLESCKTPHGIDEGDPMTGGGDNEDETVGPNVHAHSTRNDTFRRTRRRTVNPIDYEEEDENPIEFEKKKARKSTNQRASLKHKDRHVRKASPVGEVDGQPLYGIKKLLEHSVINQTLNMTIEWTSNEVTTQNIDQIQTNECIDTYLEDHIHEIKRKDFKLFADFYKKKKWNFKFTYQEKLSDELA